MCNLIVKYSSDTLIRHLATGLMSRREDKNINLISIHDFKKIRGTINTVKEKTTDPNSINHIKSP